MSKPVVNYTKDLVWFDTMPGEQMAVRLHSNQVGGALSIVEARVPSLMGPPKHFHNEREETFEILEGTFRFQVGDEEFDATPGTSVLVPRGVPHAWANIGANMGRILFIFTPGGIEDFFPEIGRHSLEEIVKIASENDTVIIGPPMVV
ncbi:quercetin dioxygenase-like cupin family protein [Paenibacillus endophyticus]|uniref:Quercetin dioxygenase-like cupin family protein n=1 Tax=Paenibacillus endophyticus TaxID=1294268 RepID=A0A7W5CDU8_9BACL|nr:cupin domain-containing protein [Paenibacillus endophyticus]MBB3155866.1 quercetin dioxygenase-like cupin family protein [Paenibacillus endophyticus]